MVGAVGPELGEEAKKLDPSITFEENGDMLSIRSNLASMNAQKGLSASQNMLEGSMSKLSSGLRITRAADDAAGGDVGEGGLSGDRGWEYPQGDRLGADIDHPVDFLALFIPHS